MKNKNSFNNHSIPTVELETRGKGRGQRSSTGCWLATRMLSQLKQNTKKVEAETKAGVRHHQAPHKYFCSPNFATFQQLTRHQNERWCYNNQWWVTRTFLLILWAINASYVSLENAYPKAFCHRNQILRELTNITSTHPKHVVNTLSLLFLWYSPCLSVWPSPYLLSIKTALLLLWLKNSTHSAHNDQNI